MKWVQLLNAVVNQMLLHSSLKVANDLTGLWCLLGKRSRHAQFLRCRSKCLELVVLFRFTFSLLPACPAWVIQYEKDTRLAITGLAVGCCRHLAN